VATVTPRPVLALLGLGLLTVVAGCLALWRSTASYLDHPLAPSSTSGNRVFVLPDGSLGAYAPFAAGLEPVVIGVGIVVVALACFLGAALHRRGTLIDG
jgi:hypothetical protein